MTNHNFMSLAKNSAGAYRVSVISCGLEKTVSFGRGTNQAPPAIMEASFQIETYDCKENIDIDGVVNFENKTINPDRDTNKIFLDIHGEIMKNLRNQNFFMLVGGEHSITIPAVEAIADTYDDYNIIHFDAHYDLREQYQNNLLSHACVIRRCLELNPKHIYSLGVRSFSREEKEFYDASSRLTWIPVEKCSPSSPEIKKMLGSICKRKVYITFDLDAFDPSIMPATGTPEPNGLAWNDAIYILREIFQSAEVIGTDIVELAPYPGSQSPEFLAATLMAKMAIFKYKSQGENYDFG